MYHLCLYETDESIRSAYSLMVFSNSLGSLNMSTPFLNCSRNTNIQIVFGVNRTAHQHRFVQWPNEVDSLQAGNHPLNRNLGPSFFKLSMINLTGPSFPLAFITLLLTTSAGAQIVVATVPDKADDRIWSGMPFERPFWSSVSLKKSYETSWEAFIKTARIWSLAQKG